MTAVSSSDVSNTSQKEISAISRATKKPKDDKGKYWSAKVTRESHALTLEEGVFTWKDPKRIARSLKRSADRSAARKASPLRSAMSMLVFYINRAGAKLDDDQKRILEDAKDELRKLYGKATDNPDPRHP